MTPYSRRLPQIVGPLRQPSTEPGFCNERGNGGRLAALVLLVLLSSLIVPGCERIRGALEDRRELTEEQKAIQAYSNATEQVNAKQRQFVEAWDLAVKHEEVEPLKAAVADKVIPALESYLESLRRMPATTTELKRIHGVVVSAYEETLGDLRTFVDTLSEDNREEPVESLVESLDELTKEEERYRGELKAYYEKHNITLIPDQQEETAQPQGPAVPAEPAVEEQQPASGEGEVEVEAPAAQSPEAEEEQPGAEGEEEPPSGDLEDAPGADAAAGEAADEQPAEEGSAAP